MELKTLERLPDREPIRPYKKLDFIFKEFEKCNTGVAQVVFNHDEYSSAEICRSTIANAINCRNLPYKVISQNGNVYLVKPVIFHANTCVVCGAIIPEGRQCCPICEAKG